MLVEERIFLAGANQEHIGGRCHAIGVGYLLGRYLEAHLVDYLHVILVQAVLGNDFAERQFYVHLIALRRHKECFAIGNALLQLLVDLHLYHVVREHFGGCCQAAYRVHHDGVGAEIGLILAVELEFHFGIREVHHTAAAK